MVYLVEKDSFDSVMQLLRSNNGGSLAQFDTNLQALAGTDTTGLDQVLGSWLTGVTPVQATGSGFSVSFQTTPGSTYSEATVAFTQALSCGNSSVPSGTKIIFPLTVQSGPTLSGSGSYRNGTLTLQGTLQGSGAGGTLRYTDPMANCDSGPFNFG